MKRKAYISWNGALSLPPEAHKWLDRFGSLSYS